MEDYKRIGLAALCGGVISFLYLLGEDKISFLGERNEKMEEFSYDIKGNMGKCWSCKTYNVPMMTIDSALPVGDGPCKSCGASPRY